MNEFETIDLKPCLLGHKLPSNLECISGSSVARGHCGYSLLYWPADHNAEQGKYHVSSTSETVFCTGINSNNDFKHILKRSFRGEGQICQK